MSPEYRILVHIKTQNVFETFGEFYIGVNRQEANQLFKSLQGSSELVEDGFLCLELREIYRDLPTDSRMIRCTLDELAKNCKIIAVRRLNRLS